jgi:hypothetical protein
MKIDLSGTDVRQLLAAIEIRYWECRMRADLYRRRDTRAQRVGFRAQIVNAWEMRELRRRVTRAIADARRSPRSR